MLDGDAQENWTAALGELGLTLVETEQTKPTMTALTGKILLLSIRKSL